MFGQDWRQHLSSQAQARGASGDFWLGQLSQLPTVEGSPLPSSAAKLGTWGQFASSGRIGNGVGQILEANYRVTGTLYNRIGEGLGWVRGPWLETLGPLAEAGSWSEWATIPTNFASGKAFSAIAPLAKSALSGQFGGLSDEQMFRMVVSTTLNVIDLVATVVPAAGPVVDLVTDLAEIGLLQGMDGEPAARIPCGEDYRAAEASAEADTAATNKILDLLKNRPDQQAPNLTPLFMPPAELVQVENISYSAGPVFAGDDLCGRGYGAFSDRSAAYQRPGDDLALGYVPGRGIHQGIQRPASTTAAYDWTTPWTGSSRGMGPVYRQLVEHACELLLMEPDRTGAGCMGPVVRIRGKLAEICQRVGVKSNISGLLLWPSEEGWLLCRFRGRSWTLPGVCGPGTVDGGAVPGPGNALGCVYRLRISGRAVANKRRFALV